MPCREPLKGYRAQQPNPSGKYSIVFSPREGYHDLKIDVPCGQCIFCRLERSRRWAVRCMHEASLHDENCFITLTYDDKNLPQNGSLHLKDYQDFMKRLRKRFAPKVIKFYHCGEYGEKLGRPHYHACLFNVDFDDKYHYDTVNGEKYYRSPILESLWKLGNSMVGNLTFESAAYVARYITKKALGPTSKMHYSFPDPNSGETIHLAPEYATMSRRPGIAANWYEKFKTDVFPSDNVIVQRKTSTIKMLPPKYYVDILEKQNPEAFKKLKAKRKVQGLKQAHNNTPERMRVRTELQELRVQQLKRGYEK